MRDVNLSGASLRDSDCLDTSFDGAIVRGLDLRGTRNIPLRLLFELHDR